MFKKPSNTTAVLFLPIIFVLCCLKCASASTKNVLTTILPLYIFTGNILNGIDGIQLELLIRGENANPHTYSMTIEGVRRISSAHVIIANGKAEDFFDLGKIRDMNSHAKIVLTHNVSARAGYLPPIDIKNPHTWLSPKRAIIECDEIGKVLGEAFPEYADVIKENLKRYRVKLETVSNQISSMLQKAGSLDIITFHDALDIFSVDFGTNILFHIEEVHGVPPSPKKLAEILDTIKSKGGRVMLVSESPEPDALTNIIAKKSKAPTIWFDPIISGAKNLTRYEETMIENIKKLVSSITM